MSASRLLPRRAVLIAALALPACGEPKTAPGPYAELAGSYQLESVNARPLPWNEGGSSWLFERRLQVTGEGRFEQFDIYCVQSGDACPRRERAVAGTMLRSGDGTLWLEYGPSSQARATFDPSGRLDVAVTGISPGTAQPTNTYRYQRQ
jgi:hypothetical protein